MSAKDPKVIEKLLQIIDKIEDTKIYREHTKKIEQIEKEINKFERKGAKKQSDPQARKEIKAALYGKRKELEA